MAFSFPVDKVGVVNSALALTGDNTVNIADDGSDEWNVASPAYERALAYIMEGHSWGYSTLVVTLQPSPTPPQDTAWDTAYPIPNDCVHIIWLKISQDVTDSPSSILNSLTLWDIAGTPTGPVIVTNAQGGPPPPNPPLTPAVITMKYVSNSGVLTDSTSGTPTMILALMEFVIAGIYRGLHEDVAEADKAEMKAETMLQRARSRYDQQKPKRQFFNSRITASRRIRRPWPPVGNDSWGGSGIPG
jgi:hypothetical protein